MTKLQADHGLYLTFNGRLHVFQILGGHRLALLPQIAAVAPSLTASEPTMRWFLHASEIKPRTWENCVRFKVLHLTKLQAAHGLYLTFYGRLHIFQIQTSGGGCTDAQVIELTTKISALEAKIEQLEQRNALEAKIEQLEQRNTNLEDSLQGLNSKFSSVLTYFNKFPTFWPGSHDAQTKQGTRPPRCCVLSWCYVTLGKTKGATPPR